MARRIDASRHWSKIARSASSTCARRRRGTEQTVALITLTSTCFGLACAVTASTTVASPNATTQA